MPVVTCHVTITPWAKQPLAHGNLGLWDTATQGTRYPLTKAILETKSPLEKMNYTLGNL